MLGDVEETIYLVEDDADDDDQFKTVSKKSEMLFVRGTCPTALQQLSISVLTTSLGDSVVLISPHTES